MLDYFRFLGNLPLQPPSIPKTGLWQHFECCGDSGRRLLPLAIRRLAIRSHGCRTIACTQQAFNDGSNSSTQNDCPQWSPHLTASPWTASSFQSPAPEDHPFCGDALPVTRFRCATTKTCCISAGSRSATKQCAAGGTGLVPCSLRTSDANGWIDPAATLTRVGNLTRCL